MSIDLSLGLLDVSIEYDHEGVSIDTGKYCLSLRSEHARDLGTALMEAADFSDQIADKKESGVIQPELTEEFLDKIQELLDVLRKS